MNREQPAKTPSCLPDTVFCVLAGGRSERMGRDKSKLRLGNRTLVGHLRHTARTLGLPVRVIGRDLVPRCGPLGGIFTALTRCRAERLVFFSCDMPFVSAGYLESLLQQMRKTDDAVFTECDGVVGFPMVLRSNCLDMVRKQLARKQYSLQALARVLEGRRVRPAKKLCWQFLNINTPEDWEAAREFFRTRGL